MTSTTKTSRMILFASLVFYFLILPSSVTLEVGGQANRVMTVDWYGYFHSKFNRRQPRDAAGNFLQTTDYSLGPDGYHLYVCFDDQIVGMDYFRHEDSETGGYGSSEDSAAVDTFTVRRPASRPFFVGLLVCGLGGWLLCPFNRFSVVLLVILGSLVVLFVAALMVAEQTFAVLPAVTGIGCLAAAVFGRSLATRCERTGK